jgi:hypothetical protein
VQERGQRYQFPGPEYGAFAGSGEDLRRWRAAGARAMQEGLAFGAGSYRLKFTYRLESAPEGDEPLTAYSAEFTIR